MKFNYQKLIEDLKEVIITNAITQSELAESVDLSEGYFSLFMSGKKKPSLHATKYICDKCDLNYLGYLTKEDNHE